MLDGALHAVMLGASESFLGALAVELGHRDVALSLLATLPLLAGALAQIASPALIRRLRGERPWIVLGATLQALTHVAFLAIAVTGNRSFGLLLAAKIAYWVSGAAIAPAWNAWMSRIVPMRVRTRYFARRFWWVHVALLGAFLGSGFTLEGFRQVGSVLSGFALLYGVALVARLGSAVALSFKVGFSLPSAARVPPRLADVIRGGRWPVALFMAVMLLGAQLAVPFFTPYMLRELGFDFREFALLTSVSVAAKALSFVVWRHLTRRMGPRVVLGVSGALIALVPLFWVLFDRFETLAVTQIVGGIAWAGYELVSLELLMSDAPADAPVEFYALASALSGATQVLGAVAGGLALRSGHFDYADVFTMSAAGRALALVLLVPIGRRARPRPIETRPVSVRPTTGVVRVPVVTDPDAS